MKRERVKKVADNGKTDKLEAAELKPAGNEKSVPAKGGKDKKKPNFFQRIGGRFKKWFKEMKSEAKKVTWPTFKQVVNNTLVVFAVVIVVGAVILLADFAFRNGLDLFISLF